ncbi:uncharacterized protein BO80DRAFT_421108 [Aspergillus ibericus CBS 121593]|uniref:Uncharacterized protein n=1 Tax=Aspergillus ibericus CBS 121593 TaxID=1448316 RepID=A0A395HE09_9EURO|nr:hypothetical protein BO80DRAFT_421108 [Aspergillus ibericus CBS 121593]RAL05906.1 hypothetical protein BO80DRAFT_421108 [Aspergillus ibericus CBS 121593]
MSLPFQRTANTNTGAGFHTNSAVSGGLKRSNAFSRKREEKNPLIDRQQPLRSDPSMSREPNSWTKYGRKEDIRPDMTRDKGKRPEGLRAGAPASSSTQKLANSYADPSPKRGGIETNPQNVRWPFLGKMR